MIWSCPYVIDVGSEDDRGGQIVAQAMVFIVSCGQGKGTQTHVQNQQAQSGA